MLDDSTSSKLSDKMNERPLGTHGAVWCVIAGACYGLMQIFSKQAYERGLSVAQFLLIRHLCLLFFSYSIGRFCMKINFDMRQYSVEQLRIPMIQAVLALFAKIMAYQGIFMIPLTVSSCIYFTSAPVFAGLLGLMCICERLNLRETLTIALSIVATLMVTMPQWFLFLGLDRGKEDVIEARAQNDKDKLGESAYYFGTVLVAASVFMDQFTNFMIRCMGAT